MERYNRQIMLPEIEEAGQAKLKVTKVLIVGVGRLSSPIILYLMDIGMSTIRLVDNNEVSLSSLRGQVLYTREEVGDLGAICVSLRPDASNRGIEVNACPGWLSKDDTRESMRQYGIVVGGCDSFVARYLIGDVYVELGEPYVYSTIYGFEEQVSVFNYGSRAQWKTHRDLYPDEEEMSRMPPPPKGVVRAAPVVTGSMEATEALKTAYGFGEVLAGKLWTIGLQTLQSNIFSL